MNLRELYIPVQPTVKPLDSQVLYRELPPHPTLLNTIYCYWQLKSRKPLSEPFIYRVVSDGCIDIFFELDQPQHNFIMGFSEKYTEFPLSNSFHYIGIRFLPAAFPLLSGIDASELTNRYEHLKDVLPSTSHFITDHFGFHISLEEARNKLDEYFLGFWSKTGLRTDKRLYHALKIIVENSGTINIETGLDIGISPRQLRRLFKFYVGDTAKTFSKVVRFQHILRAKPSVQSLRENKLFYDIGYYDQSHFIKDFKNFYGTTPNQAFKD